MIKLLNNSDWQEKGRPTYLCTLNYYPDDIESNLGLKFFEYEEHGLGKQLGAVIGIEEIIYFLFAALDETGSFKFIEDDIDSNNSNREALKVTVKIQGSEPRYQHAFEKICEELNITKSDVFYLNEKLSIN